MELLRIVSMLFVLTLHVDGASLGLPEYLGDISSVTSHGVWQLATESFAIVAVNCFVMISGYFGIRLTWRSGASFLFQCLFYSVGLYTIFMVFVPQITSFDGWIKSWNVLTRPQYWFIPPYFILMLLSPFLNAGIEALPKRTFGAILAIFALYTVVGGWWNGAAFNPNGYNIMQFVLLYMIARWIRIYLPIDAVRHKLLVWACAGYLLSVMLIFISSLWLPNAMAFAYNSPLVLVASVMLTLFFAALRFQSSAVNYLARSAFAVYLVHMSPLIFGNTVKPLVKEMWSVLPLWLFSLSAIVLVIGIYVAVAVLDIPRRRIQTWFFSLFPLKIMSGK